MALYLRVRCSHLKKNRRERSEAEPVRFQCTYLSGIFVANEEAIFDFDCTKHVVFWIDAPICQLGLHLHLHHLLLLVIVALWCL